MKTWHLSRRKRIACVGIAAMFLSISGLAFAAANHAISGTVYSGCSGNGPWFISSIARTKSGTGPIRAQFIDVNDGGLTFRLLSQSNVQIGVTQSWGKNETGIWRTFSSSVANGRRFYNSFRDTSYSCPDNQSDYNFNGTEWY